MATDAISSVASLTGVSTTSNATDGSTRVSQESLGQAEFFKLLTTQLAAQDPMNPMEDTEFISQMASFSELEMTSQLTEAFTEFTSIQQFSAAQGYIGKTVSLSDGTFGEVTSIEKIDGETLIFLDGSNTNGASVDSVYRVENTSLSTEE